MPGTQEIEARFLEVNPEELKKKLKNLGAKDMGEDLLKEILFFHSDPVFQSVKGRQVKAADFIYSFNRILDPATASSGTWIFDNVSREQGGPAFIAPDDSTLVIRLKEGFPPFLSMFEHRL